MYLDLTMSKFPWRLRLFHEGHSAIRVEWAGRTLRFDPYEPPEGDDQCILTWNEPERTRGVRLAIESGGRPRVLAQPNLANWLQGQGEAVADSMGGRIDKQVLVEALPYNPVPYATPPEAMRKTWAGLRRPGMAARRLMGRARLPEVQPVVVQLTFPDGGRLLHLNCSLHEGTDAEWLQRAIQQFGGADWCIVGVDYEQDRAVRDLIPRFECDKIHITDLVNETRAELGLPTAILTPTVDALIDAGLAAMPFVSGAGYRYEHAAQV